MASWLNWLSSIKGSWANWSHKQGMDVSFADKAFSFVSGKHVE